MISPHTRFFLAAASLVLVLLLVYLDLGNTSPGEITAAHGQESHLSGRNGCAACHGSAQLSLAEACLQCHADIDNQIRSASGLHGTLEEDSPKACQSCHSEHHGSDFAIVSPTSFDLAGVPDWEQFDHSRLNYGLNGRHDELGCADCHPHANVAVLAKGDKRFLGLDQDCVACHQDPHEGRMARACEECHGQELAFPLVGAFVHDERFQLIGAHRKVACKDCHPKDDLHSVESLAGATPYTDWRDCAACHDSPHKGSFLDGVAALAGMPVGATCESCHPSTHLSFRDPHVTLTREQHACTGFLLDAPHDQAACTACHPADMQQEPAYLERFPGRSAQECEACHADPHGGQFVSGPSSGQGCLSCHLPHTFSPHTFDLEAHQQTGFTLTGSHLETECNACHLLPAQHEGQPRIFAATPSTCEKCHDDVHAGVFLAAARDLPEHPQGECARCHVSTAFRQVDPKNFDHGFWSGFNLEGAHGQAQCEACHGRNSHSAELTRSLGRVEDHYPGSADRCETCHADPHAGTFRRQAVPVSLDGRTDCARCHLPSSFRAIRPGTFDHNLWTEFPLDGAHAKANCSACHQRLGRPDENGRDFGLALGTTCITCHADPHGGQFLAAGTVDCASCHSSADTFKHLVFDHQTDSIYPLDEQHVRLDCSTCHVPWPLPGGGETVRYKPLGTRCVDCHAIVDG